MTARLADRTLIFVLAAFAILQLGDVVLTNIASSIPGICESNLLCTWAFGNMPAMLAIKAAITALVCVVVWQGHCWLHTHGYGWLLPLPLGASVLYVLIMALVVVNNVMTIVEVAM